MCTRVNNFQYSYLLKSKHYRAETQISFYYLSEDNCYYWLISLFLKKMWMPNFWWFQLLKCKVLCCITAYWIFFLVWPVFLRQTINQLLSAIIFHGSLKLSEIELLKEKNQHITQKNQTVVRTLCNECTEHTSFAISCDRYFCYHFS